MKKINIIIIFAIFLLSSILFYLIKSKQEISLEEQIINSNVVVINKTNQFAGSGTIIKYKNKIYILSAGHLINDIKDKIILKNGKIKCDLKIVKWEYKNNENSDWDEDLVLLVPKEKIKLDNWILIGDKEPHKGELLFQAGNPNQIEDILTEERVVNFEGNKMYYVNWVFPGISGGGLFNQNKELVGVVQGFYEEDDKPKSDLKFMICVAIRLNSIKEFLKNI